VAFVTMALCWCERAQAQPSAMLEPLEPVVAIHFPQGWQPRTVQTMVLFAREAGFPAAMRGGRLAVLVPERTPIVTAVPPGGTIGLHTSPISYPEADILPGMPRGLLLSRRPWGRQRRQSHRPGHVTTGPVGRGRRAS